MRYKQDQEVSKSQLAALPRQQMSRSEEDGQRRQILQIIGRREWDIQMGTRCPTRRLIRDRAKSFVGAIL